MACGTAPCKSGCFKDEGEGDGFTSAMISSSYETPSHNGDCDRLSICIKCKSNDAMGASAAGDDGRFCYEYLRSNLFGKFRSAITTNAMTSPSDMVLVAFSGGPSSRVSLQFVHEMQCKAQKNFEIALNYGYNKLLLGSCTSKIACHVISATVKGQSYSLPADIQYVDARWGIPVMLPLHDCLDWELKLLCRLDGAA